MEYYKTYCHHDDLILSPEDIEMLYTYWQYYIENNGDDPPSILHKGDERNIRLMKAFVKWITTVRKVSRYSENWMPSNVDIEKSRLFWWIRSGHEPLDYPPPCAYSCPWYEVVTEEGSHGTYEFNICTDDHPFYAGKVNIAQAIYDLIEKVSDEEYIVGYGPYRFRAYRNVELHAKEIVAINPHYSADKLYNKIIKQDKEDMSRGWYLERKKDLE